MNWLLHNWAPLVFYLISVNVIAIIISLVVILSLPTQYLVDDLTPRVHPFFAAFRNVVGGALILAGVLMLFLPGPGVLTVFCGLVVLHSQKKQKLILMLVDRGSLRPQIQNIRRRFARPELVFPDRQGGA